MLFYRTFNCVGSTLESSTMDLRYRMGMRRPANRIVLLLVFVTAPYLRAQTSREQFDDLSRRAQAALDKHPEEAVQLYREALAMRPDWPEGWQIGRAHV